MIPHNRPFITPEDRAAVDAVLASEWIAQGPAVAALEATFVERYGRRGGACALSSGTAALFVALKALGAGLNTVVVVPSYTCSALLNAVFMAGATPRVLDVLPDTFCLDPEAVRTEGGAAEIVVAVHTYGARADVDALRAHGASVIEDCCQSLGGEFSGGALGESGDAAVFSFYASKIVTGGQGGMIWSRDSAVAARARDYREFDGRERYEPRFNFQMTDLQAALVNSQMARLDAIRARRAEIAATYLDALPHGLTTQAGLSERGRMAHRFVVVAARRAVRDALRAHLAAAGVGCIVPVADFELLHRYLGLDPAEFPVSEGLADTTLSLPIHVGLSDGDVATVSTALRRFQP